MADYFTTEIGRMRSREMVARGIRYQAAAAEQRRMDRESCLKAPRVEKTRRPVQVRRHRTVTA